MIRVTHVSTVHRARDTRIFEKQCRTLAEHGYEVHLIAGGPAPASIDGVHLHCVSADGETRPRARDQPARQFAAARNALRLRPSVFHIHDPHLIPLALVLRALGSPVIYDMHEDYPAHARTKLWHRPRRAAAKALMWRWLEALAARSFQGFVAASPALARALPRDRTATVTNYPLLRELEHVAEVPYADRPKDVIYAGIMTNERSGPQLARAMARVAGARLRMVGAFRRNNFRLPDEGPGVSSICVEPWQTQPVVMRALRESRAGLILLQDRPNHHDPERSNKLFEYMAAGLPVIASDLPRWRRLITEIGCGLLVDPADPAEIAAAIEFMLTRPDEAEAMGQRGRAAVLDRYNWDRQAEALCDLYRTVAGAPPQAAAPRLPELDMVA